MKIRPSLFRKALHIVNLAIFFLLIGFFGYLYLRFDELLTGQLHLTESTELLTKLDSQKFERVLKRVEARRAASSSAHELRNPFGTGEEAR